MRGALLLLLGSCLGCAGFTHRPTHGLQPGSQPVPRPWSVAAAIRGRPEPSPSGEVVLDDHDGLSPDEAALMAIDQNPELRAARAEHGMGQAALLEAGVLPNPTFEGARRSPKTVEGDSVLGYGAGISWNVTPLFSRRSRVSAATASLAAIDLDIAWKEWQVAQGARLHTIRAIFLRRRLEVAEELEHVWSQRLDALDRARAQGAVTELERLDAESSYAEAQVQRLELLRQLLGERAALNRAVGVDPLREIALDLNWSPEAFAASREGLLESLLDALPRRRVDLMALQEAHRSHDEALRAAVIARFPPVEIGLDRSRDVDGVGSTGLTLRLEIPFFDRHQGAVAREGARRDQVKAEYASRLLAARADVVRALGELELVKQQIVAAQNAADAARSLAEEALRAAAGSAMSPLLAGDILERSHASRLRLLAAEQSQAELLVALSLASGTHCR